MEDAQPVEGPIFAHPRGQTTVAYSPNGKYLYTAGSNNIIRKFVSTEKEPVQIETSDENTGLVASDTHVYSCSEDCTISRFSTATNSLESLLLRTSLSARALSLSPDGSWLAVASDETVVKIVNTTNPKKTISLREQSNSNKHVTFHPSGNYIAVSCTDGCIYIYSLSSEEPVLVQKVDGFIPRLESTSETSCKAAWCPDGRAFAVPTATREIVVIDNENFERQRVFTSGHMGNITDIAWSPNGAFLASAGTEGKIIVWETTGQSIVKRHDGANACSIAWHPKSKNAISFTTNDGKLYTLNEAVPRDMAAGLNLTVRPAPLIKEDGSKSAASKSKLTGRTEVTSDRQPAPRKRSPNPLDAILGMDDDEDFDDFVVDDDGAGYAIPSNSKRKFSDLEFLTASPTKRRSFGTWSPVIHEPFQPSSTPWRGQRRYLCLNMVGFVWTVDQGTHNTVTLEFHDRETFRPIHFTDTDRFDKACLNENGVLFSCQPNDQGNPAVVQYRPHETWTNRAEWRMPMPEDEEITSIALSENYIVVACSNGYVRVYTLYGVPVRITRTRHSPVVTCASFRDYVIIMGNGSVGTGGRTQLTYTLENVKRDEVLQNGDVVALPPDGELKGVYFSDNGDPVIYDSEGVLLVLQHWREPGKARWTPLLDTKTLDRLASGGKEESYWPVAVAQNKFHCIILKGGEKYPYFPRPLLSEFDFRVPLSNKASVQTGSDSSDALEEKYMRETLLLSLQEDSAQHRVVETDERVEMADRENNIDRALLQLLMMSCKDEKHGAKALEICGLFRQKRTLDMAIKVAVKYEQSVLANKIVELRDSMDLEED